MKRSYGAVVYDIFRIHLSLCSNSHSKVLSKIQIFKVEYNFSKEINENNASSICKFAPEILKKVIFKYNYYMLLS